MQPVCDDYFKDLKAPAGPSSLHLNAPVRAYLDAVRQHLLGLHDSGVAARSVNEEHADLVDRLVRKLFRLAEDRYFVNFPRLDFRIAVVAVGGYGRRELSLGSDIDLLFLHPGKLNPYVETIAEAITHRLWDARLSVGVATRTIRDCLRVGREDVPTLTSFLDSRFLIGDPGLFAELDSEVRSWIRRDTGAFLKEKVEEQRLRHARMGESLFLLQPNLRESVGGLRDYHTALWLARAVHWEVRRPEHLHIHGFIDADELAALMAALDFMWRLRNELHRAGRKDDRLHYEAQMRLAEKFGIEKADATLRAERLMQLYYGHAHALERVSRHAVQHALALARPARRRSAHAVEEGLVIADDELEIPATELIAERPVRLLSTFAVAQEHDVDISQRGQRLLRQHVDLLDETLRSDAEAAEIFARILNSPTRVYRSLKLMAELGVLGAYLPEFGRLVGLWQQDMYHTYTVDVHSLFMVEQLRRLQRGLFREELPLATELMREVRDPRALFLACILHDIGKGRGGGHSQRGAELAPVVCRRLGIQDGEVERIRFLVRHHLTMSEMAEQRDVHDPLQIVKLANLAQTREQLRSLYLLTVADIRSVSPEAWTSWKAGLLEALYRNAAEWLEAGERAERASQFFLERAMVRVAEAEHEVSAQLAELGAEAKQVAAFLDSMPRRYLLSHASSEIAQHVEAALDFLRLSERTGVYEFAPPSADRAPFSGLIVFARDQPGLFATVCGVLTACGHDILAAQAYTARGGLAVELYELSPIAGGAAEHEQERLRLETGLRQVMAGERTIADLMTPRDPGPQAARRVRPSVRLSNDESDFYTVIDVTTNDRPALLYDIARTLSEFDLNVVSSRASTRARRATDTFYVTEEGHKLTDSARQQSLQDALLQAIHRGPG